MSVTTLDRKAGARKAAVKLGIVDCDIHPTMRSESEIFPFLSKRWREHFETYGSHVKQALPHTQAYPRMQPATSRADSWPPGGGPPGCDLDFMRAQLLDAHNIETGIMHAMRIGGYEQRNLEYGAALSSAINDWQAQVWADKEPRLKGSIHVPQEFPEAAIKEIEKRAGDRRFVQVSCAPMSIEPLGRRRYWPMLDAIAASGTPLGLHIGGMSGHAITGGGWGSYYFEHHFTNMTSLEAVMTSLIFEGVFERLPKLKVVLVESGFAWVPPLCWRMDQHWARMRDEVPHVKRPPSEYVREHFYYTTQPIEEPRKPEHLAQLIDWIGWDRILFATDYPHWDYDDPPHTFKIKLSKQQQQMVFRDNARGVYGLGA